MSNLLVDEAASWTLDAEASWAAGEGMAGGDCVKIVGTGTGTQKATQSCALSGSDLQARLVGRIKIDSTLAADTNGHAQICYAYYATGVLIIEEAQSVMSCDKPDVADKWYKFIAPVVAIPATATSLLVTCRVVDTTGTARFDNLVMETADAAIDVAVDAYRGVIRDGNLPIKVRVTGADTGALAVGIEVQDADDVTVLSRYQALPPGDAPSTVASGTERLSANQQGCGDDSGDLTGFQMVNGGTADLHISSVDPQAGDYCILVEAVGVTHQGITLDATVVTTGGLIYEATGYLKAAAGFENKTVYPEFIELNSSDVEIGRSYADERSVVLTSAWQKFTVRRQFAANGERARLGVRIPDENAVHFKTDSWSIIDVVPVGVQEIADADIDIDVSALPDGSYSVVPTVYNALTDAAVTDVIIQPLSQDWDITIALNGALPTVYFDSQKRLCIGGTPVAIRGLFEDIDPDNIAVIAESNYNCVMPYRVYSLSSSARTAYLGACSAAGMGCILALKDAATLEIALEAVNACKSHAGLWAYMISDELRAGDVEDVLEVWYPAIRAADPNHPIAVILPSPNDTDYSQYRKAGDWLWEDWFPRAGYYAGSGVMNYAHTGELVALAIDANLGCLPVSAVPEVSRMYVAYPSAPIYQGPTLREIVNQVLQGYVEKARTFIGAFGHRMIGDQTLSEVTQWPWAAAACAQLMDYADLAIADYADEQPVSNNAYVLVRAWTVGDTTSVVAVNSVAVAETVIVTWGGHSETETLEPLGVRRWDYAAAVTTVDLSALTVKVDALTVLVSAVVPAGASGTPYSITINHSDGTPDTAAWVWLTSDSAGTNVVRTGELTNDAGAASFNLESGLTYYVWIRGSDGTESGPTSTGVIP